MKAKFIVTIEGDWLDNGRRINAKIMEKGLREAVKDRFEFLADKTKVEKVIAAPTEGKEK